MEIQDIRYYPIDYNLAPDNALTRWLNIVAVVASAICIVLCFVVSKDLYVVMGVVAVAIILYGHAKSSSYGELSPNNLDEQILLTEQMVEELSEALGRSKVSVSKTDGYAPLPNNVADTRYYIWILSGTLLLLLAIWWIGQ